MFTAAARLVRDALERDRALQDFCSAVAGLPLSLAHAKEALVPPVALVRVVGGSAAAAGPGSVHAQAAFSLPLFGEDAYDRCLDAADLATRALLDVKTGSGIVTEVALAGIDPPGEDDPTWAFGLDVVVEF